MAGHGIFQNPCLEFDVGKGVFEKRGVRMLHKFMEFGWLVRPASRFLVTAISCMRLRSFGPQ